MTNEPFYFVRVKVKSYEFVKMPELTTFIRSWYILAETRGRQVISIHGLRPATLTYTHSLHLQLILTLTVHTYSLNSHSLSTLTVHILCPHFQFTLLSYPTLTLKTHTQGPYLQFTLSVHT